MSLAPNKNKHSSNKNEFLSLKSFFKTHKTKLTLLFFIPFLIFLLTSLFQIKRLSEHADKISGLEQLTNLAIQLSELLHDSQKERGHTGIYLSSGGSKHLSELTEQRRLTDKILLELVEHTSISKSKYAGLAFPSLLNSLRIQFDSLPKHRQGVTNLSLDLDTGIQYYTDLNQQILDVIGIMVNESVEPQLTKKFLAYVYFIKAKEKAGIERARLSSVFIRGYFLANDYQDFIQVIAQQSLYNHEFYSLATPDQRLNFNKIMLSDLNIKTLHYRDIAHKYAEDGGFYINENTWFEVQSQKINALKTLEIQIAENLLTTSKRLKSKSNKEMWLWITLLISITLVVIIIGLLLIQGINRTFLQRLKGYRDLFENSSSGMAVINIENRHFVYCNSYFSKMTGFNQKEIFNITFKDILTDETHDNTNSLLNKLITGKITHIEKLALKHYNGSTFYTELSAFPILISDKNYIAVNINDITERLNSENQLKRSESSLKSILNSLNVSVVVVDINTKSTIYLNDLAEKTFKSENTLEPNWPQLAMDYYSQPSFFSCCNKKDIQQQLYHQDNKHWYQVTSRVVNWHDNREVCLRMLEDITDRYDAEYKNRDLLIENRRLALRNYSLQEQERKELAADLHDQLGQMMLGIRLQAECIISSVKGKGRDKDKNLESSAQNIISTSAALMESVQIITKRLRPIILDQLGIEEALSDLIQEWQQLNKSTVYEFNAFDLPDIIEDQISITIYRIAQEALTNIHKHASAQNVEIFIKYNPVTPDFKYSEIELRICDDGIGLNENTLRGNGMGLVNMRERVEALGGVFKLDNSDSNGVNILVSIPLENSEEAVCH